MDLLTTSLLQNGMAHDGITESVASFTSWRVQSSKLTNKLYTAEISWAKNSRDRAIKKMLTGLCN